MSAERTDKIGRARRRADRSLWIAKIIVAAIGIAVIVTFIRGMFGGLGGLREDIAAILEECASGEKLARAATISCLLSAQREVSRVRSGLLEGLDELDIAKIALDHARSVAPDTTASNRIRLLTTEMELARDEMTIATKIAFRRLDRIHAEIDDLVQAVEPSDTTGQNIRNAELGMRD